MQNKQHHINYSDYQPLLAYLENKLSNEDKIAFEENMAQDEFVSEAIEGLKNLSVEEYKERVTEINRQVTIISKSRKPTAISFKPYHYAVAASLIILIAAAWLFTNNMNKTTKQVADNVVIGNNEEDKKQELIPVETNTDSTIEYIENKSSNAIAIEDNTFEHEAEIAERTNLNDDDLQITSRKEAPPAPPEVVDFETDEFSNVEFNNNRADADDATHYEEKVSASSTAQPSTVKKESSKKEKAFSEGVVIEPVETKPEAVFENEREVSFKTVEEIPEFPGGEKKLNEFLASNIHYPEVAKEMNIQGIVYVKFTVNEDGSVSNAEITKGVGFGCDEEVLRIISIMPEWKPAMQNNKPVSVYYTLPVSFKLQ